MQGQIDSQPFLPLSIPSITEQEIEAVTDVLLSGWITTGPKAAELERTFCEQVGCKYAVALSSATAGMHLLLHAMKIKPGDEVISPSMTWVSTVNLISACGATPIFVDVDKETLMTTANLVEPLITEKTRLIIPVHYAGAALDLDPLRALAANHGIPLVEDAAHALGTRYKDMPIGQQSTAIFSFHPIKNITTVEGGMFCTEDDEMAEHIRRLKFHGLGVDAFDRETRGRAPQAEVLEPGFKYNLPDMNATLGLVQIKRLGEMNRKREKLAKSYLQLFKDVDEIMPLTLPDYAFQHAWHLFIVRLDVKACGMSRDEFMTALKENGIGTGLHFRAVHTQKYYRENLSLPQNSLPNTDWNSDRIISLPLFPDMTLEDVYRVVDTIKLILAGHKHDR